MHRDWFFRTQSRSSFCQKFEELRWKTDAADFICDSRNQWMRDAFFASKFAVATHATRVQLLESSSADFRVEWTGRHRLDLQATVADLPERKIGQELRDRKIVGYPDRWDPGSEWQRRRLALPTALRSATMRKVERNYSDAQKIGLFIYCNLGTYGSWKCEIEEDLVRNTAAARGIFHSVWALWSGRIYRCWPNPFLGRVV